MQAFRLFNGLMIVFFILTGSKSLGRTAKPGATVKPSVTSKPHVTPNKPSKKPTWPITGSCAALKIFKQAANVNPHCRKLQKDLEKNPQADVSAEKSCKCTKSLHASFPKLNCNVGKQTWNNARKKCGIQGCCVTKWKNSQATRYKFDTAYTYECKVTAVMTTRTPQMTTRKPAQGKVTFTDKDKSVIFRNESCAKATDKFLGGNRGNLDRLNKENKLKWDDKRFGSIDKNGPPSSKVFNNKPSFDGKVTPDISAWGTRTTPSSTTETLKPKAGKAKDTSLTLTKDSSVSSPRKVTLDLSSATESFGNLKNVGRKVEIKGATNGKAKIDYLDNEKGEIELLSDTEVKDRLDFSGGQIANKVKKTLNSNGFTRFNSKNKTTKHVLENVDLVLNVSSLDNGNIECKKECSVQFGETYVNNDITLSDDKAKPLKRVTSAAEAVKNSKSKMTVNKNKRMVITQKNKLNVNTNFENEGTLEIGEEAETNVNRASVMGNVVMKSKSKVKCAGTVCSFKEITKEGDGGSIDFSSRAKGLFKSKKIDCKNISVGTDSEVDFEAQNNTSTELDGSETDFALKGIARMSLSKMKMKSLKTDANTWLTFKLSAFTTLNSTKPLMDIVGDFTGTPKLNMSCKSVFAKNQKKLIIARWGGDNGPVLPAKMVMTVTDTRRRRLLATSPSCSVTTNSTTKEASISPQSCLAAATTTKTPVKSDGLIHSVGFITIATILSFLFQ